MMALVLENQPLEDFLNAGDSKSKTAKKLKETFYNNSFINYRSQFIIHIT